ncbi:MAG: Smr/MutS family protein [Rhodobacteraceae bacterium]|nr:Smr/MutS family protein [Paracoccaceae bacterium]
MPRRRLSPEEAELWRKVAASASPLRVEPPASLPLSLREAPAVEATPAARPSPTVLAPARPASPGRVTFELAPDPHAALARAHPHMDRRRFDKLRRGRLEPEARLDLHGMTSERAHGALVAFIRAAHATGLRLVLVITGKGRPGEPDALAPQRHGVLRHSLPHWLAAPPLASKVLQVAPAHVRHGGGGAYYVYLRRQR